VSLNNKENILDKNTIHKDTRLGLVELVVKDLARQVQFHQDILGMKLHWQENGSAGLGAGGEDLLQFIQRPDAVRTGRTTGLYHTAMLLPEKRDLAHLLLRIHEQRAPLQGMSDHGTHLAIYLPDAEGNGIELAWDRPQDVWPDLSTILKEGTPAAMRRLTAPLDVDDLLQELNDQPADWQGMSSETKIGHIHLHVSDLQATRDFYGDLLGFETTLESDKFGMVFFGAGGYHHHIGANIWNGAGAPPPPENAAGLRRYSIVLPGVSELNALVEHLRRYDWPVEQVANGYQLYDPAKNGVFLTSSGA
jgi:catechol 2,3-dioxygenase